jgi:hypothetical protein
VSALQLRVQLWSVNQQAMEAEESPLLRFVTKKCVVKTFAEEWQLGKAVTE